MYIQVVILRVEQVKPLPYEINIDEPQDIIQALVNEPGNPNLLAFGTYEEAKKRIELSIKLPQALSQGKKRVAKMKIVEGPLMLTEGNGEDEGDDFDNKDEESEKEEEEIVRKKGKVFITKTQKHTTAMFTMRTRKGKKESEPIFVRPTPTFEERMKQIRVGVGINNFKALKNETWTPAKKKEIEDWLWRRWVFGNTLLINLHLRSQQNYLLKTKSDGKA